MEIPASRWHEAMAYRRSRRRFNSASLEPEVEARVRLICEGFRPFGGARAELIPGPPDRVFRGAVGPYGKVKGAPAAIAFIGDMTDPHVQEEVGYTGEGVILEATAMGLATCWVGGFFRPKVVASILRVGKSERVLAVTPVGYAVEGMVREEKIMTVFGRNHRRKPLGDMVTGTDVTALSGWMKAALEAARIAPSAVNRQPWRFEVDGDAITVSTASSRIDFFVSTRLDCGIAMLHIEVAARDSGMTGEWQFLQPPHVARFEAAGGG